MTQFCMLVADHRPIVRFNEPNQTDGNAASAVVRPSTLADTLGLFSGPKSRPERVL
jgi:hypothetical protein